MLNTWSETVFASLDRIYLRNALFSRSKQFTMSVSSRSLSKFCAIKNQIHKPGHFNICVNTMIFLPVCGGRCVR